MSCSNKAARSQHPNIHAFRKNFKGLTFACIIMFVAIRIDKGMGLIIAGFIPVSGAMWWNIPPTLHEIGITVAVYAQGAFIFTILVKVAIDLEPGRLRYITPKGTDDDEGKNGRKFPEVALEAEGSGRVLP